MSNQANKGKRSEMLAVKLTVIVAAVVLMLAVVNELTFETIALNEAEKSNSARIELFPDAQSFSEMNFDLTSEESKVVSAVYAANSSGEDVLGYCLNVTCKGFGGDIELIVGIDHDRKITGVQLISHAETPGIGAVAVAEDGALMSAFKNVGVSGVEGIASVSGATISSKAVKEGIAAALEIAEKLLKEGY